MTASERLLKRLAEDTFLKLWTYPNLYIDKKTGGVGRGKELCDLLAICGEDIFIFSDKTIEWPNADNVDLSWSRWYRRAVEGSVKQIRGAERWLREHPDRLFLDPACEQPFPLAIPPVHRRRVHRIAVALGAEQACSQFFGCGDGSLVIKSTVKGKAHTDTAAEGYMPFAIGDVDPDEPFVHVLSETGLVTVMQEMDTVADFAEYLKARARVVRGARSITAFGEADLLTIYIQGSDEHGTYAFPRYDGREIVVDPGIYGTLSQRTDYLTKKADDRISYVWDALIEHFTDGVLAGKMISFGREDPTADISERALRNMVRETRFVRRVLGGRFQEALLLAKKNECSRFARVVMLSDICADPECAYVFLILAHTNDDQRSITYDEYRRWRTVLLHTYCSVVLSRNRELKRTIGIAIDAAKEVTGNEGGSEDILLLCIDEWTPELEAEIEQRRLDLDVFNTRKTSIYTGMAWEYRQS